MSKVRFKQLLQEHKNEVGIFFCVEYILEGIWVSNLSVTEFLEPVERKTNDLENEPGEYDSIWRSRWLTYIYSRL